MLSGRRAFQRRHAGRDDDGDPQGGSARAVRHARRAVARARPHRPPLSREESGRALPDRARRRVRARGVFRHEPVTAVSGRDSGGAGACAAGVARWRWQSSQSRRLRPACSPIALIRPAPASVAVRDQDVGLGSGSRTRASAPDGQTIVFSAAPTGNIPELFVIRPGTVTSQPLGEPGAHLLSISSKGELAVITGARSIGHRFSAARSRG